MEVSSLSCINMEEGDGLRCKRSVTWDTLVMAGSSTSRDHLKRATLEMLTGREGEVTRGARGCLERNLEVTRAQEWSKESAGGNRSSSLQ